jgi:hypothetical protein
MHATAFQPISALIAEALEKMVKLEFSADQLDIQAVSYSDHLVWLKCSVKQAVEREMIVGLPKSVVTGIMTGQESGSVNGNGNENDVHVTSLERMSLSLSQGNHKLVIAPVETAAYGELTVSLLM